MYVDMCAFSLLVYNGHTITKMFEGGVAYFFVSKTFFGLRVSRIFFSAIRMQSFFCHFVLHNFFFRLNPVLDLFFF